MIMNNHLYQVGIATAQRSKCQLQPTFFLLTNSEIWRMVCVGQEKNGEYLSYHFNFS